MNIGEVYGNWTIIDFIVKKYFNKVRGKKYPLKLAKCQCKCGNISIRTFSSLRKNTNPMCKGCANRFKPKWKGNGIGDISGTLFYYYKRQANSRGISWNITKEEIWELYLKQGRKCALSGLEINFSKLRNGAKPKFSEITASLDRINSSKEYTIENIQIVHKWVNIMKNSLPNKIFIQLCNQISKHNEDNLEPILVNDLNKVTRQVQRLIGEDNQPINLTRASHIHSEMDNDIV